MNKKRNRRHENHKKRRCWSYDRKLNTTRKVVTCENEKACQASWLSIGNDVHEITKQGCFNSSDAYDCTKKRCTSMRKEPSKKGKQKDDNIYKNLCCCLRNSCNDKLDPYISKNPVVVSTTTTQIYPSVEETSQPHELIFSQQIIIITSVIIFVCSILIASGIFVYKRGKSYSDIGQYLAKLLFSSKDRNEHDLLHEKLNSETSRPKQLSTCTSEDHSTTSLCKPEKECKAIFDAVVDFNNVVGSGHFGTVYYVTCPSISGDVCFKAARDISSEKYFKNEMWTLRNLSLHDHPNIIKYYGPFSIETRMGFLMEYCKQGSLHHYLNCNHLDLKLCLSFLSDLISGIEHLHATSKHKLAIAHRDISSSNVLIRDDCVLVIADYSVARLLLEDVECHGADQEIKGAGTPFYKAPEILDLSIDLHHSSVALKQADVYSMALVMWEIISRCKDFYDNSTVPPHLFPYENDVKGVTDLINHVVVRKQRPNVSCFNRRAENIVKTIQDCWDSDEESRLSAACVKDRLNTCCKHFQSSHNL
ncbi:activin receptor type-2A-like isoform X2 [Clavelina lepadiformis]|uniref:activin receptor type-2A-like isoform X2 n=1 Tax=Clavelina lepadiformis TaxID=159417 RepID=UPI00404217E4